MTDIGLHIEGLGIDAEQGNAGVIFTYGEASPTGTDYSYMQALVEPPQSKSFRVDPQDGTLNLPAFSPQLDAREEVSRVVNAVQDDPPYSLTADLGDQHIFMEADEDGLFPELPTVVYIGDETILVREDRGGGEYLIERGLWSSTVSAHAEGAGIYTRPPYYRLRRVALFSVPEEGDPVQRAHGYLKNVRAKRGMTRFALKIEDQLSALRNVERNRAAWPINDRISEGGGIRVIASKQQGTLTVDVQRKLGEWESGIAKKYSSHDDGREHRREWYCYDPHLSSAVEPDFEQRAFCQIDDAIVPINDATYSEPDAPLRQFAKSPDRQGAFTPIQIPNNRLEAAEGDDGEYEKLDDPIYEVGVWYSDERYSIHPGTGLHPFEIAASLLMSTDHDTIGVENEYDRLNGNLGLAAGWLFGEEGIQSFTDAIEATPGLEVNLFLLGLDGEPINPLDEAIHLLISHGAYLGIDNHGNLAVRLLQMLDVEAASEASTVVPLFDGDGEPRLEWDTGLTDAKQAFSAVIGDNGISEPRYIDIVGLSASSRLERLLDPAETEYEYPWYNPDQKTRIEDVLTRQTILMQRVLPTVSLRADDWEPEGKDYGVGSWVQLEIPAGVVPDVVFDTDGTQTNPNGDTRFVGQILERTWNTGTDAYDLTIALQAYRDPPVRLRAPSAVVEGFDDLGDSLALATHVEQFSSPTRDAAEFSEGQQVELHAPSLAPKDIGVGTIETIDDSTIVVEGWGGEESVQPGDVLRLAAYDDYTHNDFGTYRGYCYLADDMDRLGTDQDSADIWA